MTDPNTPTSVREWIEQLKASFQQDARSYYKHIQYAHNELPLFNRLSDLCEALLSVLDQLPSQAPNGAAGSGDGVMAVGKHADTHSATVPPTESQSPEPTAPRGRAAETATETAARVEMWAMRSSKGQLFRSRLWLTEAEVLESVEDYDAAYEEHAPHCPIRLVELRPGEGIWSRKDVARDAATIASLRAELKSARDDAAEWELEAVEHQANAERLAEWVRSVSSAIKSAPEFASGEWAGDKEGWGFHFEVVRHLVRELAALRAGWVEGVVREIRYGAKDELGQRYVLLPDEWPLGTLVSVRRTDSSPEGE